MDNLTGKFGLHRDPPWPIVFGMTVWSIWQWRNSLVLDDKIINIGGCGQHVLGKAKDVVRALELNNMVSGKRVQYRAILVGWNRPQ